MTKMKKKNLKPIDIDIHFKYRCTNPKCGYDHWLSLKESQTPNFKIVCECEKVYQPKPINKIKILYRPTKTKTVTTSEDIKSSDVIIPTTIQNGCTQLLIGYGFTKDEATSLIKKAFAKHPVTNGSLLVKYILQNLGELNVNN